MESQTQKPLFHIAKLAILKNLLDKWNESENNEKLCEIAAHVWSMYHHNMLFKLVKPSDIPSKMFQYLMNFYSKEELVKFMGGKDTYLMEKAHKFLAAL